MATQHDIMSAEQVRAAEVEAMRTVSEATLMARAADAVAAECEAILFRRDGRVTGRVVILAGSGNNGGDALLAGARLQYRGAQVTALLVGGDVHDIGLGECRAAGAEVLWAGDDLLTAVEAVVRADIVIDGIAGIGSSSGLRPPSDVLVKAIPSRAEVVAVDVPSGVNVDTGEVGETYVRADVTVTFTALKPCLVTPPAREAAGRIVLVHLGVRSVPG